MPTIMGTPLPGEDQMSQSQPQPGFLQGLLSGGGGAPPPQPPPMAQPQQAAMPPQAAQPAMDPMAVAEQMMQLGSPEPPKPPPKTPALAWILGGLTDALAIYSHSRKGPKNYYYDRHGKLQYIRGANQSQAPLGATLGVAMAPGIQHKADMDAYNQERDRARRDMAPIVGRMLVEQLKQEKQAVPSMSTVGKTYMDLGAMEEHSPGIRAAYTASLARKFAAEGQPANGEPKVSLSGDPALATHLEALRKQGRGEEADNIEKNLATIEATRASAKAKAAPKGKAGGLSDYQATQVAGAKAKAASAGYESRVKRLETQHGGALKAAEAGLAKAERDYADAIANDDQEQAVRVEDAISVQQDRVNELQAAMRAKVKASLSWADGHRYEGDYESPRFTPEGQAAGAADGSAAPDMAEPPPIADSPSQTAQGASIPRSFVFSNGHTMADYESRWGLMTDDEKKALWAEAKAKMGVQ